ncbi:MAG: site-specific integrase, partial [Cyanobacteria bacterium P01_C01_bin.121]
MDSHPIDASLDGINQRLKVAKLGLKIERRGQKLNLRGTLPPRPNSAKLSAYQQRIPLGIPASEEGLQKITQVAKVVAAQIIADTFDWYDYLEIAPGLTRANAGLPVQLDAFETHFFQQRLERTDAKPSSVKTTWQKAYAPYLRKLQVIASQHPDLSLPEAIYATVQSTKANSRSRQVCCTALESFTTFVGIPLPTELKSFAGNYGNSKTQLRNLPTDAEILAAYEKIPNPQWQFVYGIMATYGLRNHEVFFSDYTMLADGDDEAILEVLESTKTGQHDVWPFPRDWIDAFNLRDIRLPKVNTDLSKTTLQL